MPPQSEELGSLSVEGQKRYWTDMLSAGLLMLALISSLLNCAADHAEAFAAAKLRLGRRPGAPSIRAMRPATRRDGHAV
jgi:ABC-type nitrate/sulfonate/bicarbonate transport system permease component